MIKKSTKGYFPVALHKRGVKNAAIYVANEKIPFFGIVFYCFTKKYFFPIF